MKKQETINAKWITQHTRKSHSSAEKMMAEIRRATGLREVALETFCEYFRIDQRIYQ